MKSFKQFITEEYTKDYRQLQRGQFWDEDSQLNSAYGEAGYGIYTMPKGHSKMAKYYTRNGETLLNIKLKDDAKVVDLTKEWTMKSLLHFASEYIESLAKKNDGYIKPKINKGNIQRFPNIIESYIQKFYADADAYVVLHEFKGTDLPTGKQIIIKNREAIEAIS